METTRTLSRERTAVAAHFALLGLVCATWGSSIDDAKLLLGLDERKLGWLLFSGPAGCLASFAFASALTAKFGSRSCLILSTILYLASTAGGMVCFLSRASFPFWCATTACLAATGNLFNISMNTQAGIVERRAGRTIMGSFHAIFSLMCLVASVGAVSASYLGVPPECRLSAVFVIAVVVHLSFLRWLPKDDDMAAKPGRGRLRLPDAQLLVVGLAALVVIACEGAINNWVGVFYHDSLGAPPGQVKWGYCAVGAMTALGRFSADPLVNRYGAGKVFHSYSLLVAIGMATALSSPFLGLSPLPLALTATGGYGIAGFGISALVPILYSKTNKTTSMSAASALTFVGAMGFAGSFMVSPAIGCIANATNLSVALGVFAALILTCAFLRIDGTACRGEPRCTPVAPRKP